GRLRFLAVLKTAKLHGLPLFLALAHNDDFDFLADGCVGDDPRQVAHRFHVLAVELHDDVAGLDAGGLRRTAAVNAGNQSAARRFQAQRLGDVVGHFLNAHTEPAAPGFAELAQLIDNADNGFRGNGKADADRSAGGRDDRGVHADDFALQIEQRTARIAAIDGGVSLDVVVIRAGIDIAIARRNDTGR